MGCVKVKILNINAHEFCIWGTDSTIEKNFYSGQPRCFGTNIMWVQNLTTNSHLNAARLGFLLAVSYNNMGVSSFATGRNVSYGDETNGVGALGGGNASIGLPLGKSGPFLTSTCFPEVSLR
jgi:hypothetical protein